MNLESRTLPSNTLEFRLNDDIPPDHYGLLAAALNEPWSWLIEASPEIIEKRIKSGTPFITTYDSRNESDFIPGIDLPKYGEEIPVTILEMVFLKTGGDNSRVPRLYRKLTNGGLWLPVPEDYDTIVFVDVTAIPSRRGKGGLGEVMQTISFARDYALGKTKHELQFDPRKIRHIMSYSPDIDGIIRMHVVCGATDTKYVIKDARDPFLNNLRGLTPAQFSTAYPNHNPKLHNVRLMSYPV